MARWRRTEPDPLSVLGLPPGASAAAIESARRNLAKAAHPDVGGTVDAMQRINAAADRALQMITAPAPAQPPRHQRSEPSWSRDDRPRFGRRDHPSFTIEALPAEAFEALLVVATWLGDLVDDDPPYAIEIALTEPHQGWCRLDLVPDAGASTVSLVVAGEPGFPPPDIESVRDAWIAGLNELDWSDLDGSRPLP